MKFHSIGAMKPLFAKDAKKGGAPDNESYDGKGQ
jgi:hypothetical protein